MFGKQGIFISGKLYSVALRIGQSINPFEVKIGVLVFKVPPSGTYMLRIKGGSLPGIGYVALTPKPAPYGKVIE